MASPDNALLIAALAGLAIAVTWLAVLAVRRSREAASLRELADRLEAVASTGDVEERLSPHAAEGPAAGIAGSADLLLERLERERTACLEREQIYRRLSESMEEGVAIVRDGIELANARFAELCGVAGAAQMIGRPLADFVHPDYVDLLNALLRRHREGLAAPACVETEMRSTDGPATRVEFSIQRTTLEGRAALLVAAVEISRRAVESQRSHAGAWEALDAIGEGIATTDSTGQIVYLNPAAEQLIGRPVADVLGRSLQAVLSLVDETDRKSLGDPVRQCLMSGNPVQVGRRGMAISREGGSERSIEVSVSPLRDRAGEISGTVIALRDVSDLRGLTRQMSYHAMHDGLTGLVNKREFDRRLQEALDEARTSEQRHVLCYLDLDRFKAVNDECGHVAGDGMLREVAGILKESVRDSDTVARLGGDEFGILLKGCPLEKARQIADDIVRAVSDYRFVWKDKIFNVGVSAGLVEVARDSGSLDDLVSAADSACYVAKKQGGHVHVYSARDEAQARQRGEIHWLQALQAALKDGRFRLYTQPIVAAGENDKGDGPALEVLLRLPEDSGQMVSPAEFMAAAERYRLMPEVDRWVVATALAALGRGAIRLPERRALCINLSGQTIADASFLEFMVECIDRTGVAPGRICFEVVEQSVVANLEHAKRCIGVLRTLGCQFALDDFGSNLGSFAKLRILDIDYLKIDGAFIRNLANDGVNQAMVTAVIKLARSLGFRVVAEHVEDMSALDAARRMGVDFLQGYQVGRPAPLSIAPA